MAALATAGITAPFPIQSATLPDTLAGRDVLGRGRTGSGKTYAFALPVLARLATGECIGSAVVSVSGAKGSLASPQATRLAMARSDADIVAIRVRGMVCSSGRESPGCALVYEASRQGEANPDIGGSEPPDCRHVVAS